MDECEISYNNLATNYREDLVHAQMAHVRISVVEGENKSKL